MEWLHMSKPMPCKVGRLTAARRQNLERGGYACYIVNPARPGISRSDLETKKAVLMIRYYLACNITRANLSPRNT